MQEAQRLQLQLYRLAYSRIELLKRFLWQSCGTAVQSGPFAGMRLLDRSAEGCYLPKLLGCYEAELHELIESFADEHYECILDIGCGEGFYAVGLAMRIPGAEVSAYDSNRHSQAFCRHLAELNGVSQRVRIAGTFSRKDFSAFANRRCLVICDVEGAELELLDPIASPELRTFDILVELHDPGHRRTSEIVPPRFADTHEVQLVEPGPRHPAQFPVLRDLPQLDQWLAVWEFRMFPTPWAMLRSRCPVAKPCTTPMSTAGCLQQTVSESR